MEASYAEARSLTSADVAVTVFPVVGLDANKKIVLTDSCAQGRDGTVMGAATLVNEALFSCNVFRFKTLPDSQYGWRGPLCGGSPQELGQLVQSLMQARAAPDTDTSNFKFFSKVSTRARGKKTSVETITTESLALLNSMMQEGFLASTGHTDRGLKGWQLTKDATKFVETRTGLADPVSVLSSRALEDRSRWARYECMLFLNAAGWSALPTPAKNKPKLSVALPEDGGEGETRACRTWYYRSFRSRTLAPTAYLQAMVAVEEHRAQLLELGVDKLPHDATCAAYVCLAQVLAGKAEVETLLQMLAPASKRKALKQFLPDEVIEPAEEIAMLEDESVHAGLNLTMHIPIPVTLAYLNLTMHIPIPATLRKSLRNLAQRTSRSQASQAKPGSMVWQ